MITGEIISNIEQVDKQLDDIIAKQIPFATSVAMQKTVIEALDLAEKEFERYVAKDDEGSSSDSLTKNLARKGPGKGAIRAKWPTKADVRRGFKDSKGNTMNASVFIVNGNGGKFDLIDEIHPLVFGGTVKNVPGKNKTGVITPTSALLKGLTGKGRLKQLNAHGNFKGSQGAYKSLMKHAKTNKALFLYVPIGNNNPKYSHLAPGLYFKGRERSKGGVLKVGWRYADGKLSRSKGQNPSVLTQSRAGLGKKGRAKRKQGRIVNYLVMLLAYHTTRTYDGEFGFPETVIKSYENTYGKNFRVALHKAVTDSRNRNKRKKFK